MSFLTLCDNKPSFRPVDTVRVELHALELPLCVYNRRLSKKIPSFRVERALPDGNTFKWLVTGSAEFGLPVPEDLDRFIVLLDEGQRHVATGAQYNFSFWKWCLALDFDPTSGATLRSMHRTLQRLVSATIFAEGSWWDAESGQRISFEEPFRILDSYNLFKRRKNVHQVDLQLNWVRLSDPFFKSIQRGYMRTVDFAFYKTLPSHLCKVLYLHLLKMRGKKAELQYGLEKLRANIAYPIVPSEPHRTYRELLKALTVLGERGFIGEMTVHGKGNKAHLLLTAGDAQKMREAAAEVRTGLHLIGG